MTRYINILLKKSYQTRMFSSVSLELGKLYEGAEVALGERLFNARAAVTQNERSPIVRSRVIRGVISRWREPERRRCKS